MKRSKSGAPNVHTSSKAPVSGLLIGLFGLAFFVDGVRQMSSGHAASGWLNIGVGAGLWLLIVIVWSMRKDIAEYAESSSSARNRTNERIAQTKFVGFLTRLNPFQDIGDNSAESIRGVVGATFVIVLILAVLDGASLSGISGERAAGNWPIVIASVVVAFCAAVFACLVVLRSIWIIAKHFQARRSNFKQP